MVIAVLGAAVFLGAGAWYAVREVYLAPAAARHTQMAEAKAQIERARAPLAGRDALRARMDALGATMIAGESDEVEHRLREGLTAVARRAGLEGVALGNGRPAGESSPVVRALGRHDLGRALRAGPDFQVVRGWMTGSGTLEQVLTCLAVVQSQPWVHRVEGFSITPGDADRTRFKLRADIATIVSAVVQRTVTDTTQLVEPAEDTLGDVLAMAGAYPFGGRPEARKAEPSPTPPAADPSAEYRQWRVTGLIEAAVPEVLLLHTGSGKRVSLLPGEAVLGATFEGGEGEVVVFSVNGHKQRFAVGSTLAQRKDVGMEQEGAAAPERAQALRSEVQP